MTLGQSSPQLAGREGDIVRLPSNGRKIDAERFHSLTVTCTWGCRILLENTGKVLHKEVVDSLRICHCLPSRQQDWRGRRRILPSNSADVIEYIHDRVTQAGEKSESKAGSTLVTCRVNTMWSCLEHTGDTMWRPLVATTERQSTLVRQHGDHNAESLISRTRHRTPQYNDQQ
ncbi:hypothetical protein E2C01_051433 [Portunus trituberculatus]|uniref:Uncharacterized protein n=1 Tax=Portunus trituberculatus TaxID=210409 RepID=A0A5B7GJ36_PORTR|nr:hypothetical protein [Portunus trituberculatus]